MTNSNPQEPTPTSIDWLDNLLKELYEDVAWSAIHDTDEAYGKLKAVKLSEAKAQITQKLLEAIGEDDWQGCSWNDEFGYHGKECDKPGGCTERMTCDELRKQIKQSLGLSKEK